MQVYSSGLNDKATIWPYEAFLMIEHMPTLAYTSTSLTWQVNTYFLQVIFFFRIFEYFHYLIFIVFHDPLTLHKQKIYTTIPSLHNHKMYATI